MKIVRKMNSYDGKEWMWLEKNDGKEYPYPIHIIENVQYETLLYKFYYIMLGSIVMMTFI